MHIMDCDAMHQTYAFLAFIVYAYLIVLEFCYLILLIFIQTYFL